jgi:hypothetical protein
MALFGAGAGTTGAPKAAELVSRGRGLQRTWTQTWDIEIQKGMERGSGLVLAYWYDSWKCG